MYPYIYIFKDLKICLLSVHLYKYCFKASRRMLISIPVNIDVTILDSSQTYEWLHSLNVMT